MPGLLHLNYPAETMSRREVFIFIFIFYWKPSPVFIYFSALRLQGVYMITRLSQLSEENNEYSKTVSSDKKTYNQVLTITFWENKNHVRKPSNWTVTARMWSTTRWRLGILVPWDHLGRGGQWGESRCRRFQVVFSNSPLCRFVWIGPFNLPQPSVR